MEYPEQTLKDFASKSGLTLVSVGLDEHRLQHGSFRVVTVYTNPSGWPVELIDQHNPGGDGHTGWKMWGPEYSPHRPRLNESDVRSVAEVAELERQRLHTAIDTPQKLIDVLNEILDHNHAKGVKVRHERHLASLTR